MTATIIDGRKIRDERLPGLQARFKALLHTPVLAIVQVGDRPDSNAFIKAKKDFAVNVGVEVKHIQVAENVSQDELVKAIEECNEDPKVRGIVVQLPLPLTLNTDSVIETIDPEKDADGLTATNVKKWLGGRQDAIMPATARGIRDMLKYYKVDIFGKKVTIIGRSMLVGKPITAMCLNENATVSVCHSKSSNLADETKSADVIICATGKPNLIGKDHVKPGQTVIDVGISKSLDGKIAGDVNFDEVSGIVSAITPVPGGVGPMTVVSLFENIADLC